MKTKERDQLLQVLKERFENNSHRHPDCSWAEVESRIEARADVLRSLQLMEMTGGEPDIVAFPLADGVLTFCDCSTESPIGRRSLCYDQAALEERKANKPQGSAVAAAMAMGIELMDEQHYRALQSFGEFDGKTSSWVTTPSHIRSLGGALFCDRRYGAVFTYHNGAQSYYAARGFRGLLRI
ncbi:DUF4256 domain-containing protein [Stutzerimonas frequens]|uniref:DUF4256 domain-containing protein n=1 Tax=Stutzerimonas frequens TaxID=2968969 RepID=UPI000D7E0435|nr:DUF4256 domain-containing protein [Stutzerimonas frequens]AWT10064.1 DUF4256 domain-containing protein [Stutzerimonas frequens]